MRRRIAWMMHPVSGDVPGNLARAKRWLGWLLRTFPDIDFAADWIPWCEVLDDGVPANRERGLRFDEHMIQRLDDCWMVGGRISNGMMRERVVAMATRKTTVDLTTLGDEPPNETFPHGTRSETLEEIWRQLVGAGYRPYLDGSGRIRMGALGSADAA